MEPSTQIVNSWMEIILPYVTDKAIIGALISTWILIYYVKPYVRSLSVNNRRSLNRLGSFIICGALVLWWKADDQYVYEIAFILGILNPLLYMFFVDKILTKFWPELAEKLKNKESIIKVDPKIDTKDLNNE